MKTSIIAIAAILSFAPAAFAGTESGEIVWPTYSRVVRPGDMDLTCTQLRTEIDRVKRDIHMLNVAQRRAEEALSTASDLNLYLYSSGKGGMSHTGNGGGEQTYSRARSEIVASLRVAEGRLAHLNTLTLICTP